MYQNPKGLLPKVIAMAKRSELDQLRQAELLYRDRETRLTVLALVCDSCGHVELFHFPDGVAPPLWKPAAE